MRLGAAISVLDLGYVGYKLFYLDIRFDARRQVERVSMQYSCDADTWNFNWNEPRKGRIQWNI